MDKQKLIEKLKKSGYDASWGVRYDASAHPAVVSENAQGSYEADFDTNEQSVTENEKTAEWQDNDDTDAYGQMSLMDLL